MKRFINAIKKITGKTRTDNLSEMDELYHNAMSKLSDDIRLDYCRRLIERTKYEIRHEKASKRKQHLETLIQAAENEIQKIKEQNQYHL